jgi:rhamnogalacturonan endolyase
MLLIYIITFFFPLSFSILLKPFLTDSYNSKEPVTNRGITAIRKDSATVFISWSLLDHDPDGIKFNIYRDGRKLNRKPLDGPTSYTDKVSGSHSYSVQPASRSKNGMTNASAEVWNEGFLRIPLNRPQGGELNGRHYTYSPGDASVADLDGDGTYEIVLKWDPSNARDNAQDGFTAQVFIDAYKLDGTKLWRIDLGRNIRAGAHYTQFLVYDLDGNGKAEMICKTADGTIDGKGKVIGSPTANYVNSRGRILSGPEYLTIFDGLTGEAVSTADYIPGRGNVCGWGNNECIGNRSDRFLACVACLDGVNPSAVFCRGYYGRLTICAWDFREGRLTHRWLFDTDIAHPEYMGQGNHNLSVADIDNDGRDEIVYGSSAYDDNGTPLYTTGMGHGDAMHLGDLDPDNPGLEVWSVKETGGWGSVLHRATDGKILFSIPDSSDVGRGLAADIYPEHPGYELWSSATGGIYNIKGEKISVARPSVNFRIYWDGDLQDELLDRSFIDDWDHINHKPVRLLDASVFGGMSINGTKATPVISADILGDWREEVIFRGTDNESLLLFSTTIPTQYRIKTLMSDHVYRMGVVWQNVVYNQPPHLGYYLPDIVSNER